MSTKKPSLSAALHEASRRRPITGDLTPLPPSESPAHAASREGKRVISGHFDQTIFRQFKQLALDNDRTVQQLPAEAINDLILKYDKKR